MIKYPGLIQKAHRLSMYRVAPSVKEVFPGQHFHLNDDSEWEYADGSRKSYPTLNSRFAGQGVGSQGELLEGRDDVTKAGMLACLKGNFEITTDMYDKAATFTPGHPLVAKNSVVTPYVEGTHDPIFIIGYVTVSPTADDEFITYEG